MKNLTPKHLRCTIAASCPSVTRLDDGRLRIQGQFDRDTGINIETGKAAIIIYPDLLSDYVKDLVQTPSPQDESLSGHQQASVWDGLRPAVRARLTQAVEHLLKTGALNRSDIERIGEVSKPQASSDIAEIQDRLPHLMRYDKSAKCYVLTSAVTELTVTAPLSQTEFEPNPLLPDFESKAKEIMAEACLGEPFARNGVDAALRQTITAALTSADKAGYARGLQAASDGDVK